MTAQILTIEGVIPLPADPYLADDQAPLCEGTRKTSSLASSHTLDTRPSMPTLTICSASSFAAQRTTTFNQIMCRLKPIILEAPKNIGEFS